MIAGSLRTAARAGVLILEGEGGWAGLNLYMVSACAGSNSRSLTLEVYLHIWELVIREARR